MKNYINSLMGLLALTLVLPLSADTVINYDDGSTYTLEDNQKIYITTSNSALFTRQVMSNKDTYFKVQKPWSKRDYVPDEDGTDEMRVGSHEWCKAYIPWHEGLTFDMVSWQRACDTNNDNKYGCGDDKFDSSEDGGVCNN